MYIRKFIAENKFMQAVWISCLVFCIIFIPISARIQILYSKNEKKCAFNFYLYFISVLCGYATNNSLTVYIHYSNRKAVKIDLEKYILGQSKFQSLKGISLISEKTCLICGIENDKSILLGTSLYFINNSFVPIVKSKYPFFNAKNDLYFVNGNKLALVGEVKMLFNLFSLILLAMKFLIDKVLNGKFKQK